MIVLGVCDKFIRQISNLIVLDFSVTSLSYTIALGYWLGLI